MLLSVLSWLCSSLLAFAGGGKLPEAEVKIEVLHRPFICHRKSKFGDVLLLNHEGYFENGTIFHSRYGILDEFHERLNSPCRCEVKQRGRSVSH